MGLILKATQLNDVSVDIATRLYDTVEFAIIATGVSTGADISIFTSPTAVDGTWTAVNDSTKTIGGSGATTFKITDNASRFMRVKCTAYTDGSYDIYVSKKR